MHLLGNMVFLILTGFAVEAAIGSLRFFAFYILSGIAGGLFFALFSSPYSNGLVGASGAISGVMTMYVVLFQARKIQFFYWFFVFTGYFKAAAIIMLPFYLGFEVYKFISDTGSNVAYTAHIGGFIAGAALIYLTQSMNTKAIDETYIEGKEEVDPFDEDLQKLYNLIGQCSFHQAWSLLKKLKALHPDKQILIELEYNLVRALHPQKSKDYLIHRMDKIGNSKQLIIAQLEFWKTLTDSTKSSIKFEKKSLLLRNCLSINALESAENIFNSVKDNPAKKIDIAVLARRIATHCQSTNNASKLAKYDSIAQEFLSLDKKEINADIGVT
jgi:hypothetical protein